MAQSHCAALLSAGFRFSSRPERYRRAQRSNLFLSSRQSQATAGDEGSARSDCLAGSAKWIASHWALDALGM